MKIYGVTYRSDPKYCVTWAGVLNEAEFAMASGKSVIVYEYEVDKVTEDTLCNALSGNEWFDKRIIVAIFEANDGWRKYDCHFDHTYHGDYP
jgi:hypothetical protein